MSYSEGRWAWHVCRNEAGTWAVVHSKRASIPPWIMVDGPYERDDAVRICFERNQHRAIRLGRHEPDGFRPKLL